jgi:probable F420-dependent oxidoreductase
MGGMMQTMTERDFRFGIVTGLAASGAAWTAAARRAEDLGYDTLLIPDTVNTLAPFPALAAAAASTRTLRVGTYVLSAPNRTPGMVAWETKSLHTLTGGRFELGLGGGRPGADRDAAQLGADFGTPGERLRRVEATIHAVRELRDVGSAAAPQPPPPILVAASRPRMLRLAAEHADIVAFGLPPQSQEDELAGMVADLRNHAGSRFDSLELHLNVAAVAENAHAVPEWVSRMVGGDPRAMASAGGIAFLLGTPAEIADVLRRRRDDLGISYIAVNAMFMEEFAPVIARLRGTAT